MVARSGKLLVVGLLLAALSTPAQVSAQGWTVDLYAGVGLPLSDLNNIQNGGFSGGFGAGYIFPGRFMVRGDFAGEFFQGDQDAVNKVPELAGLNVRMYHLDGSLAINFVPPNTGKAIFAFDFGAGVTLVDFSGGESTDRVGSTTRFTIPAGVIFGYKMSDKLALFIRGRYYVVFMDQDEYGSGTWQSIPIWAGLSIRG